MHTSSVVLLPGSLCDRRLWQHQLSALAANGTLIFGDLTRDDRIAAMAQRVLAAAPPRFALVGLSLGGMVALEIVRQAPARVTRLALLGTNARPASAAQQAQWQEFSALIDAGEFAALVRDRLFPAQVHPERRTDDALRERVTAMAATIGPQAYRRQLAALAARVDSRPFLPEISCPTLVAVGREDAVCPLALHAEIAAAIPDAQLAVVERCGHLSSLEQPEQIAELLYAWLKPAAG